MKPCKKPCTECPFRKKSLPGYLGGFGVQETMMASSSESIFVCHKTRETGKELQCAGRLMFAKKSCKLFRNPEIASAQKIVLDANKEGMAEILELQEFTPHHDLTFLKQRIRESSR